MLRKNRLYVCFGNEANFVQITIVVIKIHTYFIVVYNQVGIDNDVDKAAKINKRRGNN